jgi:DNA polymerase-1
MDTLQLVDGDRAKVYTLRKGLNDTILYNEDAVVTRFGFPPTLIPDYKGLRGDPSDNIPGVKGVGEKTAGVLIGTFGTLENVYNAIKKTPEKVEVLGIKGATLQKLRDGEEDAKFSKMLAEIRRDAPIHFKLPAPWREHVSPKEALDMLQAFEFRSLIPRVKAALMIDSASLAQKSGDLSEENGLASADAQRPDEEIRGPFRKEDLPVSSSGELFSQLPGGVSEEEIQKIGIAAWVLDSNATQPTLDDICRIGRSDTFAEAKENILADIAKNELSFIYDKIELPLYPVLREMEKRGVLIDTAFLSGLSKTYKKDLGEIAKRIYAAAGSEFNVNSPKQLGEVLFDKLGLEVKNQKKTATGARSTRESELEKLREAHPIIGDILSYRELQKLLSTYIDTIPTLLGSDGRLHTSYVQTGTTTGRLASLNPNLQNIPIKTELGRAIRR